MEAELAKEVITGLKDARVQFVVGLPDSTLLGVFRAAAADQELRFVPVTNEAEGVSVAAGIWASGKRSVLMMENSGLRAACEALSRLGLVNGVPVPMLMGYRGDLGERFNWGINHGVTMEPLLQAMRIPYRIINRREEIRPVVKATVIHATSSQYHAAVVFRAPLISGVSA